MSEMDNAIVAEEETPALRARLVEAERLLECWTFGRYSLPGNLTYETKQYLAGATPAPARDALAEALTVSRMPMLPPRVPLWVVETVDGGETLAWTVTKETAKQIVLRGASS